MGCLVQTRPLWGLETRGLPGADPSIVGLGDISGLPDADLSIVGLGDISA